MLQNHARADASLHPLIVRLANEDSQMVVVRDAAQDAVYPLADIIKGPFLWIAHENAIGGWDEEENEVTLRIVTNRTVELNGRMISLEIFIPSQ